MSWQRLLALQVRSQNRIFWRTPIAAFFTLILPVMMLVLFVALFGNEEVDSPYGPVELAQFYTAGLAVFSAATATYTNLGINLSQRRELGILKRVRSTPLPPWIYLAGAVISAVWIALIATAVMLALGMGIYGVGLELAKLPALLVSFGVGALTFAVLGFVVAALAPTFSAAPAITNATLLPMAFVSDVFIPVGVTGDTPRWLQVAGEVLPLKHFVRAFGAAMNPFSSAPAFELGHLLVLGLWLLVGAVLAQRRFGWG